MAAATIEKRNTVAEYADGSPCVNCANTGWSVEGGKAARATGQVLQVQGGILPVFPLARAAARGAVEMKVSVLVFFDADIAANEEMLALGAETRLVQRPPLFQGVVLLEEAELAAGCLREGRHGELTMRRNRFLTTGRGKILELLVRQAPIG